MKKNIIAASMVVVSSLFCFSLNAQTGQQVKDVYEDLSIFEDPLASKLKKNVKKKDLNKINHPAIKSLAEKIQGKKYQQEYLLGSYKAILSPSILGDQLSIGDGYSKYENITGVYLAPGEHLILVDGIENNADVSLLIPNWLRKAPNPEEPTKDPKGWGIEKEEFELRNGVNIINLENFGGLAYVSYFSENPETSSEISLHFITGDENGVFDIKKHNNSDWDRLIENSVYPILDALGEHIQVAYPTEALKKYAPSQGVELISNYDSLVYRQHRIMGLVKYNRVPNNKILSRVNYNYYMFRDGDGVAYMGDKVGYAMHMVADPAQVINGDPCWGFSHEVGHVHQTRPMFNWGGLGEVSNNLFSLYVTRSFGNKTRISEQNNYESARQSIIDGGISYLADEDVFNRLVPFWQLQLYFEGEGNNPDFYPDLFEAFRKQGEALSQNKPKRRGNWASDRFIGERNPAVHQLNFIKTACKVSKVDLTEFFDQYGFFYVGELTYDDYGPYTYIMTQEMVDECKAQIKAMNLPQPRVEISTLRD